MKILITGGLGFIGTNLVNFLTKTNFHEFIVVDNLINAYNKKMTTNKNIYNVI